MSTIDHIEDVKSLNIRSTALKRSLLISPVSVKVFQSFLEEYIRNEVLIINTSIGMEVYYYSNKDYSLYIKDHLTKFLLKHIDHSKLKYRIHLTREEVHQSFFESLYTFSHYPQIFLAYSKKFIYIKKNNSNSAYIMPILNAFFEEGLQLLSETGKVPYYKKIQSVNSKSQKSENDKQVIQQLISEILLKMHSN